MRVRAVVWSLIATVALCGCDDTKTSEVSAPALKTSVPADAKKGAPPEQAKASLPKAADLLAKSVEASGGIDKLSAVKSFHYTGEVDAPKLKIHGKVEAWWKNGDFYMVQDISGLGLTRSGKSGEVIWMQEPINGLRTLKGVEAEQNRWASSLLLTAHWQEFFSSAQTVEEVQHDGKQAYAVKLTSDSKSSLTLTVDATSFLVVAQAFDVESPMGKMPITMKLLDFREVEGVKIPFRQETDMGLMKLQQVLTSVEFNTEIDAAKFVLPDELEVVKGDAKEPPVEPLAKPVKPLAK